MSKIPKNGPRSTDPDLHFRTDHIEADLKGRSIRSGAITLVAQVAKFILRTASTIILARLLTPLDYGLLGMVTVVVGFLDQFRDLGLSLATIQRSEVNHRQVSTLFWINLGISAVLMVVTWLLAPGLAWFYQEPRLTRITIFLGMGFIFGGLSVQHQALLRRQMRFGALAAIEITSMLVSVGVALIAAQYGAGYWSLVILQLIQVIVTAVGVWVLCGWRPGSPVRNAGVRSMLAFGGNFTGFSMVNYLARNFDNVIIGWRLGAGPLGLYAKAYQLLLLPIEQISLPLRNVAIPTLCRLQNEPERYRSYYHKAILVMVTLGMPIIAFCFITADNLIVTLLGSQWTEAVPIFQVLSVAAFLGTFNMAAGWAFISFGRTDRQFHWSIISSSITVLSFVIGIRWGTIGVAAGYSISRVILQVPGLVYAYKDSPLRLRDLAITLSRPTVASIGAGWLLFMINSLVFSGIKGAILLLINCVLYGLFYLGLWLILPNGRQILLEILQLSKELRPPQQRN